MVSVESVSLKTYVLRLKSFQSEGSSTDSVIRCRILPLPIDKNIFYGIQSC